MTIQTKLNIGQEAWFIHENKATTRPVGNIDTQQTDIADLSRTTQSVVSASVTYGFRMYKDHPKTHGEMTWLKLYEHQVFVTKEELLASL